MGHVVWTIPGLGFLLCKQPIKLWMSLFIRFATCGRVFRQLPAQSHSSDSANRKVLPVRQKVIHSLSATWQKHKEQDSQAKSKAKETNKTPPQGLWQRTILQKNEASSSLEVWWTVNACQCQGQWPDASQQDTEGEGQWFQHQTVALGIWGR